MTVPTVPSQQVRPPRRWLAVALAIVQPPLGFLYLWDLPRALVVYAAVGLVGALTLVAVVNSTAWVWSALILLLAAAFYLATVLAVAKYARPPTPRRRPGRLRLAVVMLGAVVAMATLNTAELDWLKAHVAMAYRIPSDSMEPAVLAGDFLFARPRPHRPLQRGMLVVYARGGNALLKRVIGLAGDTIAMRAESLFVNGRYVPESYAVYRSADQDFPETAWQREFLVGGTDPSHYRPTMHTWGPLAVPAGRIFVLGDNRDDSLDSRMYGFISADSVSGVPGRVYMSIDPEGSTVRLARIGHLLQ